MGSLPGWWLGENDGRTRGPLLNVPGWDVSLKKAGFSGVDMDMQGVNVESREPMSLIVSTKSPVSKVNGISASKYTIITTGTPICTAFADSIRLALDMENSETDIIAWSDFKTEDIQGSYCISLAEWDAPILATITDEDWQKLHTLMYKSLGTLWMTAGAAMDTPNPSASLMTGLARVFRHEHDNLAFATMDVELADSIDLPIASAAVMRVAITHSHATQSDSEFAARGPVIYVPRVERASNMSSMLPDLKAHGTQDPIPHTSGVVQTEVSSDATYIIAGLGGIGREIGRWLAKRGAKHLVLLSRSATSCKENIVYAKDLYRNYGTSAWLFDCDIADRTALQKVLANIGHLPPVKGVINGAMVMKDVLIENMTTEDLRLTIGPKVYGTLNLHDLLPKDLDFFVMLSSVAGVAGYRGTGNYAGANTFQDAFAFFRRSLGQRATTIDISYLLDVGIVTERDDYAGYMKALGMQSMCVSDLLDLLTTALHADSPAQIIYGLPTGQAQPGWYWTNDVRFAGLVTVAQAKPPVLTSTNTRAIQEKLSNCTNVDTTTEYITKALTERLAQLMMLPVTDVDPNEPLSAYGVDSLVAVELRSWILKELSVQVSTLDITADGPMTRLVSRLAAKAQGHE
ncbi:Beta-ketoacyl synthase domain-containing protein [Pyrenophora tritici-repentis]|nr:Beta-ketoacyl synthase domain-containing protein [Pyrenophora tritici-repentis]KAI0604254.1 Beta-ketoacyl synthase domain-containing protein [Pyrenophora tritici-repentis]KAI0616506.1 Beta-ketoacyl synthase domain-containing protein [Pyrenophora tritici-repentis]